MTLSDEETVLQIQEGPYLQYFSGFSSYKDEQPFAPSLFVDIRKRMGQEVFSSFEQIILEKIGERKAKPENQPEHHGKLLVDATVCEQAIRYSTDISLLNEAREVSESLTNDLYKLSNFTQKPRTYRQNARRDYLKHVKNKHPSLKQRRRCIREQQSDMHKDRRRKCDDRIVSISQPHVRPIVRGKAKKSTGLVQR